MNNPVALLAEGVDRNSGKGYITQKGWAVALLAEGVDRNPASEIDKLAKEVALLAEGVDRNLKSLSQGALEGVALLAEGVDRNWSRTDRLDYYVPSPSSRRAWIEMTQKRVT